MTTRITLTILLTTWVVLIVGETAAFYTARQSLLALMDDNMITRAESTLEIETSSAPASDTTIPQGDSYEIRNANGDLVMQTTVRETTGLRPELEWTTHPTFETGSGGKRLRVLGLR